MDHGAVIGAGSHMQCPVMPPNCSGNNLGIIATLG